MSKLLDEMPSYRKDVDRHAKALDQLRQLTRFGASERLLALLKELEESCREIQEQAEVSYEELDKECDALTDDVYTLTETLDECVADRAAMLERLKMSDFQWSAQGGSCESDFDPPTKVIS